MIEPSIIVAFISLFGLIIVALLNRDKYSRSEALDLERRLTSIENTLTTKLDPIWNVIIKELPKVLISPHTPRLDALLKKAMKIGFNKLTEVEAFELDERLTDAHAKQEAPMMRVAFSLVKVGLFVENPFSR